LRVVPPLCAQWPEEREPLRDRQIALAAKTGRFGWAFHIIHHQGTGTPLVCRPAVQELDDCFGCSKRGQAYVFSFFEPTPRVCSSSKLGPDSPLPAASLRKLVVSATDARYNRAIPPAPKTAHDPIRSGAFSRSSDRYSTSGEKNWLAGRPVNCAAKKRLHPFQPRKTWVPLHKAPSRYFRFLAPFRVLFDRGLEQTPSPCCQRFRGHRT